jgi:8-oxo-dGTP diphosphatase
MPYLYDYPRPALTADIIVFSASGNEILLIMRDKPPFEGMWALPGGYVDIDEDIESAAKRELKEETNLEVDELIQFRTYGKPGRDPRGRTVTVVFIGHVQKDRPGMTADSDARCVAWFKTDQLPDLAFDHREIIRDALSG